MPGLVPKVIIGSSAAASIVMLSVVGRAVVGRQLRQRATAASQAAPFGA